MPRSRPLITDIDAANRHRQTRANRRKLKQTLRAALPMWNRKVGR